MPFLLLILLAVAVLYAPQMWARHVLSKHGRERPDLPGSGHELALHLIRGLELDEVTVELTEGGDHYDPLTRCVRLQRPTAEQRSLTSLVVACHEVGHAIQHAEGYRAFEARTRMVLGGQAVQKVGAGLMMATPVLMVLTRSPKVGLLMVVGGLATLGTASLVHLVTLPVEWDASFRRALPLMTANRWIAMRDRSAAREILTACALTYVASSLASLLNMWRWLALLRR